MSKKEEKTDKKKTTKMIDDDDNQTPLEDLVEDAYQSILEESDEDIKVISKTKSSKKEEEKEDTKDKKTSKSKKKSEDSEEAKKPIIDIGEAVDIIARDEALEIPVTDLPGVGPATSHKLKESGLTTIRSIALSSVSDLVNNADIGEKTAQKLIKMCQEQVGLTFATADTLYTERMQLDKISTGSENLDELFGGGIETGSITEFYGEFRTGKTQIAHQLCVMVQLPREQGGLGAKAAYIDTEGTFRPERIVEIAERFGLDPKEALLNITVGRAYTSDHQINLARDIGAIAREKNIRLVIVDSLTSHFRAEYIGRGTLASRQQNLNQHIHFLLKLAEMHHVAVVVTNQVMARPDFFFGDPTAPVGGHIVAHSCTIRVYLRKSKQTKRVARVVDSPNLPEVEAIFEILADGIHDG
ncbi:MAG TPA: DNA repair and recombination protein RadA [candidate division Zixibacteria bacterium]|nr:DNA repair and recombination protein RadA [candidate division Zixibacteria bacterium]